MSSVERSIDAGIDIGEIFLDKYRVDAILGHGAMGIVAQCTHLALDECVAIKMLRRDVLDDAAAVERFMREAQAASKLKSEYVARVTDVGRSSTDVPYMVMEYLEGHDLEQLLKERGSIARPWAVELVLQACEALAEAHSIGIVHRDVKPSNLFVTWRPDGSALIKVLDFGIAKAPIVETMLLTQTQNLLGTPAYMSPEQTRSARMVDSRTDIWSLGTVLYELLEGRRPFEAESFSEMCVKVAVEEPAEMTHTPPALQQIVLRCLAKAPEQRYASMAELASDLVPFSRDPHQAQVLVQRMSRMLRRSQALATNQPQSSMPMQVREIYSAEREAEATADAIAFVPVLGGAGVDPALPALPVGHLDQAHGAEHRTEPAADAATDPESLAAEPAADEPLLKTYALPRRRRGGAVLVAAVLAGAAAIGVAISILRGPPPPSASTAPSERTNITTPVKSVGDLPPASGSATPKAIDTSDDARDRAARDLAADKAAIDKSGKPGNRAAAKPTKRPAASAEPATTPECKVDPFAKPHGSNACSDQ